MAAGRAWALWRDRMGRYERSGLTVVRFCDEEGVSAPSFYQWRKRLASRPAQPPREQRGARRRKPPSPAFQQLTLTPGRGVVSIELASGVRMKLPAENLPLIRAVVAELLQAEPVRSRGDA